MASFERLLAELEEVKASTVAPQVALKGKQFMGDPDEYELTEDVPTMDQFLDLCDIVRDLLNRLREVVPE